ncbi:MAG: response regulator [Alphaproteobacteria bacterium]|nr:response regulator [Alphaproteobacteria bacterium]
MTQTAKKLLVMDDDVDFAELVSRVGAELGYSVLTLTESRRFQAEFAAFRPDVVFLDIVMPDIDGTQLVRWLSRDAPTIRLIIATGYNPYYLHLAETLGQVAGLVPVAQLRKPIPLDELRAALKAAL